MKHEIHIQPVFEYACFLEILILSCKLYIISLYWNVIKIEIDHIVKTSS